MSIARLWLLSLSSIGIISAQVQTFYGYHPQTIMALGRGFSPHNLAQPKVACLASPEYDLLDVGSPGTQVDSELVTNSEELRRALKIDARVDASYLSMSASASFSYDYSSTFSSDSVTLVTYARTEHSRRGIKSGIKLTPEANAILQSGGMVALTRTCGTHLVIQERRGSSVNLILRLTGMSESERTSLIAKVRGGGGSGALKVEAEVAVSQELQRASKAGRLNIALVATGGTGFGGLSSLISASVTKNSDNILPELKTALAEYVKTFGENNAVPIGFHVTSLGEALGLNPTADNLWSLEKERLLLTIVDEYRIIDSKIRSGKSILDGVDPRSTLIPAEKRVDFSKSVEQYTAHLSKIADRHSHCKIAATNSLPSCSIPARPKVAMEVPDFPSPPKIVLLAKADDEMMDEIVSQSIVFEPSQDLLSRVRAYRSGAEKSSVLARVSGMYLRSSVIKFERAMTDAERAANTDVSVSLRIVPVNGDGASWVLQDEMGQQGILEIGLAHCRQTPNNPSGVLLVEIQDGLGRIFRLRFASVTGQADGCKFAFVRG